MIETKNIIYKINPNLKNKTCKLICFDLDHTLIKPKQGRTHANSPEDVMLWHPVVPDKIMEYYQKDYKLVIFSNQSDILNKPEKKKILEGKIQFKKDYLGFSKFNILISCCKDYCRKPNIGLFEFLLEKTNLTVDYKNSFMVGDAAGRIKTSNFKKDFACSDRMFAENASLKFYTPEEFFLGEKPRKYEMVRMSEKLFPQSEFYSELKLEYETNYLQYQVIMLYAPPASGKSTLARELENLGYYRINQDTLKTKGKCVKMMKDKLKENPQCKIVLDNTNSKLEYRKSFTEHLNKSGIHYCLVKIDISKEQCFFLDNYRCKLERKNRLPDVAIHSHFKFRENPKLDEGFQEIIKIQFIPEFNSMEDIGIFNQYF
jgi:bifunctional polynucleotide phosphatase/kinase